MTTIAFKNGIIAADSRVTVSSDAGGDRNFDTKKLFRKTVHIDGQPMEVILATAGESAPGSLFVEQWGTGKSLSEIRELFTYSEADFSILVVTSGGLFEVDKWCVLEPVYEAFYAIGSGSKIAMGAMEAGASAQKAVEIACKRDPFTALPVVTMRLKPNVKQTRTNTRMSEVRGSDAQGGEDARRPSPLAVPVRRRRPRGLLQHDQPPQGSDHPVGAQQQVNGVQQAIESEHEALHHNSGAERDSDP